MNDKLLTLYIVKRQANLMGVYFNRMAAEEEAYEHGGEVYERGLTLNLTEHDATVIENLRFPTMLRKMWSGREVEEWLKQEATRIRQQAQQQEATPKDPRCPVCQVILDQCVVSEMCERCADQYVKPEGA